MRHSEHLHRFASKHNSFANKFKIQILGNNGLDSSLFKTHISTGTWDMEQRYYI